MSDLEALVDSLFAPSLSDDVGGVIAFALFCAGGLAWLAERGRAWHLRRSKRSGNLFGPRG
jgi:hypothetical protein